MYLATIAIALRMKAYLCVKVQKYIFPYYKANLQALFVDFNGQYKKFSGRRMSLSHTVGNAIQYRPSPSYRMLSGNPGKFSMNVSTDPLFSPFM